MRDQLWGSHVGTGLSNLSFGEGVIFGMVALIAIVWVTYWKFMAIWHAVKHDQKIWVVVFLLVNTFGILEILYLYWLSKYHKSN